MAHQQLNGRRLDSFTLHYYLDSNYSSLLDSTWSFTVMLLSSASVGLPYLFSDLNPPIALILFFTTVLVTWYCGRILIMLADTRRVFYFDKLVMQAFGVWASWFVLLLTCTFSTLAVALNLRQTSAVILWLLPDNWVSDKILAPMGFEDTEYHTQLIPLVIIYGILNIPQLFIYNTLPSVSHMSLIAVIFFSLIIPSIIVDIVPIIESGNNPLEDDDSYKGGSFWEEWITPEPSSYKVVGTLLYVFGPSYNSLTLYNSLRMRRIERGLKVVKNGTLIASTLLVLFAITGFVAYLPHHGGDVSMKKVRLNILNKDFDDTGPGMAFARVFFVLYEFFKFPLDTMIARVAIKRFRRKFLQLFNITGEDASSNCHLELLCYCVGSSRGGGRGGRGERRGGGMGGIGNWFGGYNRSRNSSENSSARQSHDVQGGGFVGGGGIIIGGQQLGETIQQSGGSLGAERGAGFGNILNEPLMPDDIRVDPRRDNINNTNDSNMTDNDGLEQDERGDGTKRRFCTINCGKRKITVTFGIGTWIFGVCLAVVPKMSSFIVILGGKGWSEATAKATGL